MRLLGPSRQSPRPGRSPCRAACRPRHACGSRHTPYIIGQPFRIEALEALLADFAAREDAWIARGDTIVAAWEEQQ